MTMSIYHIKARDASYMVAIKKKSSKNYVNGIEKTRNIFRWWRYKEEGKSLNYGDCFYAKSLYHLFSSLYFVSVLFCLVWQTNTHTHTESSRGYKSLHICEIHINAPHIFTNQQQQQPLSFASQKVAFELIYGLWFHLWFLTEKETFF